MKNLLCKLSFFSAYIGLLVGCESGVEIGNIPPNELISVSSFISTQDSMLSAYIYHAGEIGTVAISDSFLVKNAQVTISDGLTADTLAFSGENGRYETKRENINIEPLKPYFLTVRTPSGETLKASCTIPANPVAPTVSGHKEGEDFVFSVRLDNTLDFKYFTLIPFAEGMYDYEGPNGPKTYNLRARFLEFQEFPFNNQQSSNKFQGIVDGAYRAEDPKLTIYLRNLDENLYRYLKAYQKYQDWDANNSGNWFPNFQEPQPIHSNIIGGVGIFGGYSQTAVEVEM